MFWGKFGFFLFSFCLMKDKIKLSGARNQRANTASHPCIGHLYIKQVCTLHTHTHIHISHVQVDMFKENISYRNEFLDIVEW